MTTAGLALDAVCVQIRRMTTALAFDTYAAAKTLRDAGFDEAQAEAAVAMVRDAFAEGAATRADIADVKAEIADVKAKITDVKAELKTELKAEIAQFRAEVKAELQAFELRMTLRLGGLIVAGFAFVAALDKLP